MDKNKLILALLDVTKQNLNTIEELLKVSLNDLNKKEDSKSWSALECISHLNIYGRFYIPEIENALEKASISTSNNFKSGFLGGYFVNLIKPKEKLNPMKTLDKFNPIGSELNKEVLITFKEQQNKMLALLPKAAEVNLTKAKTAVSISKLIKMRLGDTLQFVIYHNQRHLIQAKKAAKLII